MDTRVWAEISPEERLRLTHARIAHLRPVLHSDAFLPKESLIIPIFGSSNIFAECLLSIRRQSLVRERPYDVEVIIIEDGVPEHQQSVFSQETVLAAIAEIRAAGASLTAIQLQSNHGRAQARNIGLSRMSGSIVFFIDGSMILDPDFLLEHLWRHARLSQGIALLGFKQNIDWTYFLQHRDDIVSGKLRPDFRADLKWSHVLTPDETGEHRFRYSGHDFKAGDNINYMQVTNNFKNLNGTDLVGHRSLPSFFQTNVVSVPGHMVINAGGFEPSMQGWGLEDTFLGSVMVAQQCLLIPCPSSVAFNVDVKNEPPPGKRLDLQNNKDRYFELISKRPIGEYTAKSFENNIRFLKNKMNFIITDSSHNSAGVSRPRSALSDEQAATSLAWKNKEDAGSSVSAEGDASKTLFCFRRYSDLARKGLDPHILTRIQRPVVHTKYLPAIARGLSEDKKRIIAIVAPAGYGRSTILGEIYDALTTGETWTLLLRCNDLIASPEMTSRVSELMGQAVSDELQPLERIVGKLVKIRGKGVLLIDTVDLILNEKLVPTFRRLLFHLTDLGATGVFTCRDHEYSSFLEPVHNKHAGLVAILDRFNVPEFSQDEVLDAARAFIQRNSPRTAAVDAFGQSILRMSADDRCLKEVTQNPLLLALICDLFADSGRVPQNLTVSRLYATYWKEKIATSRKFGPQSTVVRQKEGICLTLASTLARRSYEHLSDSIFQTDLQLATNESVEFAYADLLSEDVLRVTPGQRVSFFHQTFLEYAIARWLATESGASERNQIIATLSQSSSSSSPLHWWPIVRQLLTLVDNEEFRSYTTQLGLANVAAFRVAAFAAASHETPRPLQFLREKIQNMDAGNQQSLLVAIDGISRHLLDEAIEIATLVLKYGNRSTASNAAQVAGRLVLRSQERLGPRICHILKAIKDRTTSSSTPRDERSLLTGWFLQPLAETKDWMQSGEALEALREEYLSLGDTFRCSVVEFHLDPLVSPEARCDLVLRAIKEPLSNTGQAGPLRIHMTRLWQEAVPTLVATKGAAWEGSILSLLHTSFPKGWESIQVRSIGYVIAMIPKQIGLVVSDLLQSVEPARIERDKRDIRALIHAINSQGAEAVFDIITSIKPSNAISTSVHKFRNLCKSLSYQLSKQQQDALLKWTHSVFGETPITQDAGVQIQNTSDISADNLLAMPTEIQLKTAIAGLSVQRIEQILAEPRFRNSMQASDKQSCRLLVELNTRLALSSADGVRGLVRLATSSSKKQAIRGSLAAC